MDSVREIKLMQPKKKAAKVNLYDIEYIGVELRTKLKIKNIPFEDIERHLISKSMASSETCSIAELAEAL
jgi:hypothetical protein